MSATNVQALVELAGRVEAAVGADRRIDQAIHILVTGASKRMTVKERRDGSGFSINVPAYTASLDVAMSLVPEGWQGEGLAWWTGQPSRCWLIETKLIDGRWTHSGRDRRVEGKGATPAIALCQASLLARAAIEGEG